MWVLFLWFKLSWSDLLGPPAMVVSSVCGFLPFATYHNMFVLVAQLYPTLCNPMDCSPPGCSIHGILQARILEWVVISFSRGFSRLRDWIHISCICRSVLYHWVTSEVWYGREKSLKKEIEVWHSSDSKLLRVLHCFQNKQQTSFPGSPHPIRLVPSLSSLSHQLSFGQISFPSGLCVVLPVASDTLPGNSHSCPF